MTEIMRLSGLERTLLSSVFRRRADAVYVDPQTVRYSVINCQNGRSP